jgi:hypothetical protein
VSETRWQRGEEHESKVEIQEAVAPYRVVCTVEGGRISPRYPSGDEMRANARRVVALWNACAGLSTEALESGALAKALEALASLCGGPAPIRSINGAILSGAAALRSLGRLPPPSPQQTKEE